MMKRGTLTTQIRSDLNGGNYLNAVLETSADLEFLFFSKLFFEKEIKSDLMAGWTLGRYIDWVCKLKLIDGKYESLLKDFNKVRNLIVHQRYTFQNVYNDIDKLNFLARMILQICDFMDANPIEYKFNQELENEYSKFSKKMMRKYGDAFNKK